MNKREKPWEKKRYLGRKAEKRTIRKILIVCEGEKTEPYYFNSFRNDLNEFNNIHEFKVEAIGKGYTPGRLVIEAISMKQKAMDDGEPYYEVWCVFDKDDNSNEEFNGAIQTAEKNKIRAAYSNPAFELWYYLHFYDHKDAEERGWYIEELNKRLGHKYEKNSKSMYDELLDRQLLAINRAKNLFEFHKFCDPKGFLNPAKNNPSTKVCELVEKLNERLLISKK